MKISSRTHVLVLTLCLLLAGLADAQGRGKKGRGGGKKKQQQQQENAKKAKQAAQKKSKEQQQAKTKQLKDWASKAKQQAEARQAAMKSKLGAAVPEMDTVFRKSCASCHVVPDPELAADGVWLASLETTLCRSLTPEMREGLSEFLRDAEGLRPNALTTHAEPAPGQASIAANLEGEVFLRAESGSVFRLAWGPDQAGQKRVIAPGKYQLYGYRVFNGNWTLSASGSPRPIVLKADQNLSMRLEPELEIELAAAPSRDKEKPNTMALEFGLRDAHGQGVSVYRGGTRMQIPFHVETDAGGTQHGVMAYTSEGRAEATIEVPVGQASFARVHLPTLPFPVTGAPRIPLPGQP